jgi:hypothetical protein
LVVDIAGAMCKSVQLGYAFEKKDKGEGTLRIENGKSLEVNGLVAMGFQFDKQHYDGSLNLVAGSALRCKGFSVVDKKNANSFTANGTVYLTATNTLPEVLVTTFNNLVVAGGVTTLTANLTISGNLTVQSGATLELGTFTANRSTTGGTLTMEQDAQLRIGGTNTLPANYSTYTLNALSTTHYYGTTQAIAAANYGNLFLQGGEKSIAGNIFAQQLVAETDCAITVALGGSLQLVNGLLKSSATGTASLLNSGSVTVTGLFEVQRHMIGNRWNLVASPVAGQTVASFLTDSRNKVIPTNGTARAMMDYNEAIGWNAYFTNTTTGSIAQGKGYSVRTLTDNAIVFSGNGILNGTKDVSVICQSFGWNLIGNPYTTPIWVNQPLNGFLNLTSNVEAIDLNYLSVYYWDKSANNGSGGYVAITRNGNSDMLAVGQGFFVKTDPAASFVRFTSNMQSHNNALKLKSASTQATAMCLNASLNGQNASTQVVFDASATTQLDPGFDAGLLRSGNGFDVYTRLVEDNGIDFMVQALPEPTAKVLRIPLGINATKSGEISFSVGDGLMPSGYEITVEDVLLKTQTRLVASQRYSANIEAGDGAGRFYLLVGRQEAMGKSSITPKGLAVYVDNQELHIVGAVKPGCSLVISGIDGRKVKQTTAVDGQQNIVSLAGVPKGVYFLNVYDGTGRNAIRFMNRGNE